MNNLVVKQDRPLHVWLIFAIAIVLLSTLTWLFLDKSHWAFIMARITGNQQMREILQINRDLELENAEISDKVLWLERNREIDEQTTIGIREELVKLQDEFYKQKGELEFYKGIMNTTENSQGLNVQGFHVQQIGQESLYQYRLILINVTKADKIVEGNAKIILEGALDGEDKRLDFSEISTPERNKWSYKFKNFKRFEGSIILPEGFIPKRVGVQLLSKGKQEKMVERTFEWLNIAN